MRTYLLTILPNSSVLFLTCSLARSPLLLQYNLQKGEIMQVFPLLLLLQKLFKLSGYFQPSFHSHS